MTIASNIRAARLLADLLQTQVAEAMGVSERTYQRWESGECTPDVPTLRRLAGVLGVTVSTLIEETE